MAKMVIPAATLRDPKDSQELLIKLEDAGDCDGSVCGQLYVDRNGEESYPDPHHHLIESGREPEAGPRIYPV